MVESVDSACMHATGAINHDLVHLHREHIDGFPSPPLTHLVTLSKTTGLRVNVTDSLQPILRGIIPPHESQRGAGSAALEPRPAPTAQGCGSSHRGFSEGWMINRLLEHRHGQDLLRKKDDLEDRERGPCPVRGLRAWKQRKNSEERERRWNHPTTGATRHQDIRRRCSEDLKPPQICSA